MSKADDAKAAVDTLSAAVDQLITQADKNFVDLQAAIANGADPATLQAIIDEAAAETAKVKDSLTKDTPAA